MFNEIKEITETVELYFQGTYCGDSRMLRQAFHAEAKITGIIKNEVFDWSLEDFIKRVTLSPTAKEKEEVYDKEIIFIDREKNAAMVKARVVVNTLVFIDYITLLKIEDRWIIRNKSFVS